MHEGSNEEDILPLFPGLERENGQSESLLKGPDHVFYQLTSYHEQWAP